MGSNGVDEHTPFGTIRDDSATTAKTQIAEEGLDAGCSDRGADGPAFARVDSVQARILGLVGWRIDP